MVLFLDFDGVLHPLAPPDQPQAASGLFACVHLLERVLRAAPHVEVVISSAWREHHPLHELREYFSPDIQARIVDVTPLEAHGASVPQHLHEFRRHAQCLAWLARRRPADTAWLAIDDDGTGFHPTCENLLLIDGTIGLSEESSAELLRRLRACLQ